MFDPGDVIDDKYFVDGVCSDAGGMGVILLRHASSEHAKVQCSAQILQRHRRRTTEAISSRG